MQHNLADLYESLADAFPDRLALVCGDTRLTFGELDVRANRLANHWRAHGLGEGSHIGLYLYNGPEYVEAMLAAWKIRARTINVNYRYVAKELAYIIDNARLDGLLVEPELQQYVDDVGPELKLHMLRGASYEEALAAASPTRSFGPRSPDDWFILYTGGTTGMPRGVVWRHEDLFFAALQGGNPGGDHITDASALAPRMLENGDGLHVHPAAPMIHGSAQLGTWIALFNGGVAGLVPGRSFDAIKSLDLCAAEGMHTINLVGDAMALPLVDALEANPGRWKLGELQVIASAGAILSGNVRKKLEALLPHAMVLNNFGASETGHQGTAFYEDDKPIWIMDERHTVVLDEDLKPVQPGSGKVGKLARFGHIPQGYFEDEAKTAGTFKTGPDGVRYVIPGDMAMVAEDETVIFLGRGSVCINSGGEKVYAEEVEEALKHHPSVFDAVVVGVPDDRWGQRVEAIVVPRGEAPDAEALTLFCREHLAGYKTPRAFWMVDDLNRQPSGKPDYRWAREHAIARATR